jgi:hypothetical protein
MERPLQAAFLLMWGRRRFADQSVEATHIASLEIVLCETL